MSFNIKLIFIIVLKNVYRLIPLFRKDDNITDEEEE